MKLKTLTSVLLGIAGLALTTALVAAGTWSEAPGAEHKAHATAHEAPDTSLETQASQAPPKKATGPMRVRRTAPPLPNPGFTPVRPMNIVQATYDFAAQYPEILRYVPCYCGCGAQGHTNNENCFVARRDTQGNVLQWDTHGFGCAICIDVAREAMQLHSSGADVVSIRAAIERKWTPGNAAGKTPTPFPPKK